MGKYVSFETLRPVRGDPVQDRSFQDINTRVYRVSGDLVLGGLLGEPHYSSVRIGLDKPVSGRIHDPGKDNRGLGLVALVVLNDFAQVGIRENIAVHRHCCIVDQMFPSFQGSSRASGEILVRVTHGHAVVHAVAEDVFDLPWLIGEAQDDLRNFGALYSINLEEEKRDISQRHYGFGRVERQRTQSRALSSREYECLNHACPSM